MKNYKASRTRSWTPPALPRMMGAHSLSPFYDPGDEGNGSADGDTDADADGDADGDTDADADEDADGDTPPASTQFDPKAKYTFPGVDKPMTVKQYAAHVKKEFIPRSQVDGTMKAVSSLAAALKDGRVVVGADGKVKAAPKPGTEAARHTGQPATAQEKKDLVATLEAMEGVADGRTLANVVKQIRDGTLDPMARTLVALAKEVQAMRAPLSAVNERRENEEFGGRVARITKALKLPTENIEGSNLLADMIRDRFYSYEDSDRKAMTEDQLKTEVVKYYGGLRKFFRNLEKAELTAAQTRQKNQLFPRASATTVNGKSKVIRSNRDRAAALFAASPAE